MSKDQYKSTLNLPQTNFPMRGNLPHTEPQRIKKWQEQEIYQKIIAQNQSKKIFCMIDGPPYANGSIHLGHVLNKVLKDIIIKYKNLSQLHAPFIPGWDCHGLPIELKAMKKAKFKLETSSSKETISKKEKEKIIRNLCRKEALKWVKKQSQEFERLGILADWKNPYLTLDPKYEAEEIRVLSRLNKNGLLYLGKKPVHWCPVLKTALAAAEAEYHPHKSPSIYVKFHLKDEDKKKKILKEVFKKDPLKNSTFSFVIWTTTPWTLPANKAIALHPRLEYRIYEIQADKRKREKIEKREFILLASALKEKVQKETGLQLKEVREEGENFSFKGIDLEGLETKHPFLSFYSPIVLSEFVTADAGTGSVHTAPGHGMDDYKLGLKYKLPIYSPVDESGRYTKEVPEYEGQSIWEVNPQIISRLKESNHLLASFEIEHSYPHNPRTLTPLIFRSTPQWFIKMDDKTSNLRKKTLKILSSQIQFIPEWGKERLKAMLEYSPDWCLSRQRIWGVPIPVLYCKKCNKPLMSVSLMNRIADLMEETNEGLEAYHSKPIEEMLQSENCSHCGAKDPKDFKKGEDILDVWFDSGVSHTALEKREKIQFPSDIYIEGSDQHRGWFQTSLLSAMASREKPPYLKLITHGFVVDQKGYKMSKSKGNVIEPNDIVKKYGADILRFWVASEDYGQDLHVSEEIFQRVTETYRKIRNTLRFLLGNLFDFDFQTQETQKETKEGTQGTQDFKFKDMPPLDQWMLVELNQLVIKTKEAYESFNFYKVYHLLNHFFTVHLSSFYLDILKDRLYTWKTSSFERRASQLVFYHLLSSLIRIIAPILSFLAEEVYAFIPGKKKESVFLTSFPSSNSMWNFSRDKEMEDRLKLFLSIRSRVQKSLEKLRFQKKVGSSLEAKVILTCHHEEFKKISDFKESLLEFLIVSQIEIHEGDKSPTQVNQATKKTKDKNQDEEQEEDTTKIQVVLAEGKKCPRCWHYSQELKHEDPLFGLCPKCVKALS